MIADCIVVANFLRRDGDKIIFKIISINNITRGEIVENSIDTFFENSELIVKDFDPKYFDNPDNIPEFIENKNHYFEFSIQFNPPTFQKGQSKKRFKDYNVEIGEEVTYFYVDNWNQNLFDNPSSVIKEQITTYGSLIPLNEQINHYFDKIKIEKDLIIPFSDSLSIINEYKFDREMNSVFIKINKKVWCVTKKGLKHLNRNNTKISSLELLGEDSLKLWLKQVIVDSKICEVKVEDFISICENLVSVDSNLKQRFQRAKNHFQESILDKEDIETILNKDGWKNAFKNWCENKKIEYESILEKEKKELLDLKEKEINDYRDIKIEEKKNKLIKELKKIEEEINRKKKEQYEINELLQETSNKLTMKTSHFITMQDEYIDLQNNKIDILKEFEEKKNSLLSILGDTLISNNTNQRSLLSYIEKYPGNNDAIELDEDDNDESVISTKLFNNEKKQELVSVLHYPASIVPSISYAYTLAHFVGSCSILNITVEHEWYHFSDFIEHGLVDFWNSAFENENQNFILILQNINMIPIASSLQPLLDILAGVRPSFTGQENYVGFPPNLRIMATVLPTEGESAIGLKLDDKSYKVFNFVGNPTDELGQTISTVFNEKQKKKIFFKQCEFDMKDISGFARYESY